MKRTIPIFLFVLIVISITTSLIHAWIYVCIDPGHGGTDAGCVGRVYGVMEKDVNLGVGLTAYNYFGLSGWDPIMTRYEDIRIDRPHRVNIDKKACKIVEND